MTNETTQTASSRVGELERALRATQVARMNAERALERIRDAVLNDANMPLESAAELMDALGVYADPEFRSGETRPVVSKPRLPARRKTVDVELPEVDCS